MYVWEKREREKYFNFHVFNAKPYFPTEPNSNVNRRNWQILSILTSTLCPNNIVIQKYLQVHLRKCCMDTSTDEGKFARFAYKVSILSLSDAQLAAPSLTTTITNTTISFFFTCTIVLSTSTFFP